MWVVYGYKDGDDGSFEDASEHVWGPFNRGIEADEFVKNAEGSWQFNVIKVKSPDGFSWR
jgi:hypothetical protein